MFPDVGFASDEEPIEQPEQEEEQESQTPLMITNVDLPPLVNNNSIVSPTGSKRSPPAEHEFSPSASSLDEDGPSANKRSRIDSSPDTSPSLSEIPLAETIEKVEKSEVILKEVQREEVEELVEEAVQSSKPSIIYIPEALPLPDGLEELLLLIKKTSSEALPLSDGLEGLLLLIDKTSSDLVNDPFWKSN